MDSSGYLAYIFDSDRTIRPTLRKPEVLWHHRLESYFPSLVNEAHITPSCMCPVDGDPDMVGSQVIVDNGGYVKCIFTIDKGGRSASIMYMER